MGLRDIEIFNTALLAKSGWRILQNPDSVSACALRGNYRPSCLFMSATLGSRVSYAWRSIWEARACWRDVYIGELGMENQLEFGGICGYLYLILLR